MKELFEKNKKLFTGVVIALVVVMALLITGIVLFAGRGGNASNNTGKEATVQTNTADTEKKEPEAVTEEAIEEISPEAVTAGALEIVEDSPLDVVEPTQPAVSPTPLPSGEATPAPSAAPGVNLSDMAQNVQYPYEIHVNKQMNCITVYAMDNSGQYSIPLKAMVCSTGAATPLGVYQTPAKYIWKVLKGNVWGQYSTRISGAILFHSVPYRTNSKSALISKYYNKLGTTASAGCVRLTTADAKWIYDNCPLGTTVVIYNDSNPGPLGKPSAIKVPNDNKWDPTDPDPANPWRSQMLRIEGVANRTVERGNGMDFMSGVSAVDGQGNNVTGYVQVATNADLNKAGVYGVHYSVTDAKGMTVTADSTLTVIDTQSPVFSGVKGRIDGKKASEITRELLLSGVSVTDNGQPFDINSVEVQIPSLQDGENAVRLVARDASGNQNVATVMVYCDKKAPVIVKNATAANVLELNQAVPGREELLKRIQVQDASPYDVTYTLSNEEWGYKIEYTVTDAYGNVSSYTDRIQYLEYTITGSSMLTVADITQTESLKAGLSFKDSKGRTLALPSDMRVVTEPINDLYYRVVYYYQYRGPLGTRNAVFERIISVGE